MNVIQIVFSPTGGTQKAADILTEAWEKPVRKIDLTNPEMSGAEEILPDDIAVIAVPSFGGRVPALATQRLSKISGNGARCVLLCVYGNRAYEDTLVEMKDLAEQSGFVVTAAVSAVAEHSIAHQYAAGRPDEKDREALQGFAARILEKLNADASGSPTELQVPGNRPYKKAAGAGMVPKAGGKCNGCGLCAEKCPAQAIDRENVKTADSKKCISCMRCVAVCPQSARKVSSVMVSAVSLALKKACSERKDNELFI